ncbi:surfactant protein B [Dictyocaulus viviparus]|uniref:Surfactant protein B n=1 Tax=Dictyocaulus viviparus TaxID=29172 RepID=A0A0D8XDD4_DICVI|nr:surfactant protein B [Dictyocaulus viviparus]
MPLLVSTDQPLERLAKSQWPTSSPSSSSNLACFFCSQLLSASKHRVGLSQNQLKAALNDKCRALPIILKEQCFTFVETTLPEIYFSLNYDFSTKDICVRLNICDENGPLVVNVPPSENYPYSSTTSPIISGNEKEVKTTVYTKPLMKNPENQERLMHKTVDQFEEKRITCLFCERMLENAKNYAVTAKADINSFANTACSKLPKGLSQQNCYDMTGKKTMELAKFVDQQVIESLWCAELNQC